MKICFITQSQNLNTGSYRIHVHDLNNYFNQNNIESTINPKNIDDYDIHIYGKGDYNIKNSNKINGSITPSSDCKVLNQFSFIIVGSWEEKESMINKNKNIFLFPQIEKMYLDTIPKIHIHKDEIVIGYHGNQNHLNHCDIGLKNALERLNKVFKIKFVYTCSNSIEWIQGKPNIKMEFIQWNMRNIHNTIQAFDIGVIPNISEYYNQTRLDENIMLGKYATDMKIRFKNKSNIGRLLVLAQCGIPVVADITPSNMHILGNPDNGFAVITEDGWYNALYQLCEDHELRNIISKNAYDEVKRLYNPYIWADKLYKNIVKLCK